MRLYIGLTVLLLSIFLYSAPAKAQVVTVGPDSVRVLLPDTLEDSGGFFLGRLKDLDKPAKAALYSAVIPGAGQFYNRAYWKIPIVYATGAVLGYFLIDNNNKYQDYRSALNMRSARSSVFNGVEDPYYDHQIFGAQNPNGKDNLQNARDFYRRNRDLTILISIGAYGLQIAEAYVHAHLKEFDVSDNLTLRVQPNLIPVATTHNTRNSLTPALTFTLYTRSK